MSRFLNTQQLNELPANVQHLLVVQALEKGWDDFVDQSLDPECSMPVLIQSSQTLEIADILWNAVVKSNKPVWVQMLLNKMDNDIKKMVKVESGLETKPLVRLRIEPILIRALVQEKFKAVDLVLDHWRKFQNAQWENENDNALKMNVEVLDTQKGTKETVVVKLGQMLCASNQVSIRLDSEPLMQWSKTHLSGRSDFSSNILMSLAWLAPRELFEKHYKSIDPEGVIGSYYNAPTFSEMIKDVKSITDSSSTNFLMQGLSRFIDVSLEQSGKRQDPKMVEKELEKIGVGLGSAILKNFICHPDAHVRENAKDILGKEVIKSWMVRQGNKIVSERWCSLIECKDDELIRWLKEQCTQIQQEGKGVSYYVNHVKDFNEARVGDLTLMQKALESENSVEQLEQWYQILELLSPGLGRQSLEAKDMLTASHSTRKQTDFLGYCMLKNNLDAARWALQKHSDLDRTEARSLGRYFRDKKMKEYEMVVSSFESLMLERKIEKISKTKAFAMKVKQHEKEQEKMGMTISVPAKMRRL